MSVRPLVMVARTDRQLRHDADVLKYVIAFSGVGLDLLELIIGEPSRLVQCLGRDTDFSDIVEEGDISVLINSLLVVAEFSGEHGRIFRHTGRVTIRIAVLHIDNFRECFDDLADEQSLFPFLLDELFRTFSGKEHGKKHNDRDQKKDHQGLKSGRLRKCFRLHDGHSDFLLDIALCGKHLQAEGVLAAGKVRIGDRSEFRASDRRADPVEAFKRVCHLRIDQRIVETVRIHRQFSCSRFNGEISVFVRIDLLSVRIDERHYDVHLSCDLIRFIDVRQHDARRSGDIEISFICQFTVGVGGGKAGKSVVPAVEERRDLIVGDHFLRRNFIDTVTA